MPDCQIGTPQQEIGIVSVIWANGDTDRRRGVQEVTGDRVGPLDRALQLLRKLARRVVVIGFTLQHGELVAAQPRHEIAGTDSSVQTPGHDLQ